MIIRKIDYLIEQYDETYLNMHCQVDLIYFLNFLLLYIINQEDPQQK